MGDGVDSPCIEIVHDLGKYPGIMLPSHVLKMLEGILDGRIRRIVECEMGEEQQGFRRGRGTADGKFTLIQLVEKRLQGQGNMALGFIDKEKTYNNSERDGHGHVEVDGCSRGGGEDVRRHV